MSMQELAQQILKAPSMLTEDNKKDESLAQAIIQLKPQETILYSVISQFNSVPLLLQIQSSLSKALQESVQIQILELTTDPHYLKSAEALLKEIQVPAKLVRAQIAYLNLLFINDHIIKAQSIAQSVRASATQLTPLVQSKLDLISAKISAAAGDYFQAAGYFQEALNLQNCVLELLLTKLLSGSYHELEKIASEHLTDKTKLCIELSGILQSKNNGFLSQIENISNQIDHVLSEKLLEIEIQKYVKKALKFYEKVQISHISEISGVRQDRIADMIQKMILNDDLEFAVDGRSGVLHRQVKSVEESVNVLRKGVEVVSALNKWM
ncbi:hypothetical protein SS50377_23421 [Spironucleus salmonicida]|uniref:PCI domain-containing protein n=1 Tax=Spironucleus salmonicida TaxID=348837 RepID=V6LPL0_9EUKA|nr:hypothetical protein SS50377_23421 [Spironucleus salmonicida]|eukprot:EST46158.1 hypothetical protein SS50377_13750 [Spironucleus salmonicida]